MDCLAESWARRQYFEQHITEDLNPLREQLWFATFAQASAWQKARSSAKWTISNDQQAITLNLPTQAETRLVALQLQVTGPGKDAQFRGTTYNKRSGRMTIGL